MLGLETTTPPTHSPLTPMPIPHPPQPTPHTLGLLRCETVWWADASPLGHKTITARHRGGDRRSEHREIVPAHPDSVIQYMATSKMLSCWLLSRAVKSFDLFLEFQLMNMSSNVQRASSLKCTITCMTIVKKFLHPQRFNSNFSTYSNSFHFILLNALFWNDARL